MATFADMKQWVAPRLQDPNGTAVSPATVGQLINQAKRYWKNRRFFFNEVTDSTVLTESDPSVPLPDNWLTPSVDSCFVIFYSGIRYPLQKVSETEYNTMFLSNGIGQPFWFSKQANAGYKVYPNPDRDYTLLRFYLKDYAPYVEDTDTDDFSEYAEDLIQYTALWFGSNDLRQDTAMADRFEKRAKDEYQNLLVTTRKDNATGSLTVASTLMGY